MRISTAFIAGPVLTEQFKGITFFFAPGDNTNMSTQVKMPNSYND